MIKICCDRCGEEIKGTTYYTINIRAEDIEPFESMKTGSTSSTFTQKISESMEIIYGNKKHYCEKCKNEIEKFIGRA